MEEFVQVGYYLRLPKEQYKKYIERAPAAYEELRFVYLFIDAVEEIPNHLYVWGPLDVGADSGAIDITEKVPLKTEKTNLIYQYFRGCKTMCRQYTSSPAGEKAMSPDAKMWDVKTAPNIGYLDESNSPFAFPSPMSEIWMMRGVKIEMLAYNPTSIALTPMTNFIGQKMLYSLIEDEDLIDKLEKRIIPSRPITLEKRIP